MVDRIQKTINKLGNKERNEILVVVENIKRGFVENYNVKKLKGYDSIYRVRKGKLRIIYHLDKNGKTEVLAVERRNNTTYNF